MTSKIFFRPISNAPLIVLRILFGGLMAISLVRFAAYGWIDELYVDPQIYFPYSGFEWVTPLGQVGMYAIFSLLFITALTIMLGWHYRISCIIFFILFTYVELIDKTNYLNHYYFISLISFLLIWLPAHRRFSLDTYFRRTIYQNQTKSWAIWILKFQLGLVYFFAGLAKLNYDWLFNAMPLSIWLPAKSGIPVIGYLFNYDWVPYVFSWSGAFYDLTIVFFLLYGRTRKWAYIAVILFHLMTAVLFNIGMFPYIMISFTLIFFSSDLHEEVLSKLKSIIHYLGFPKFVLNHKPVIPSPTLSYRKLVLLPLALFVVIQFALPIRSVLYPGSVFWTEEGYRFSWRVMLMEKSGYSNFIVSDRENTKKEWVNNIEYLTPQQEKMMSTQPDMILQYAHILGDVYRSKGFKDPKVYCYNRVTLNGSLSKPLVDPNVNLLEKENTIKPKDWLVYN